MNAMSKLKTLAARAALGIASSKEIISIANDVLEMGMYSDSIAELSYMDEGVNSDKVLTLFINYLEENGLTLPDKQIATKQLISEYLKLILNGVSSPRLIIRYLKNEVLDQVNGLNAKYKYVGDGYGLQEIISMYYAYDDIEESPETVSYDNKFGLDAMAAIDNDIRGFSEKWLKNYEDSSLSP